LSHISLFCIFRLNLKNNPDMLSKKDVKYLNDIKITEESINEQMELLKKNDSYLNIHAPATPDKGIKHVENINKYVELFDSKTSKYKICKFVPASGAATRMFKRLIVFEQNPTIDNFNVGDTFSVQAGFERIKDFAFFDTLKSCEDYSDEPAKLAESILDSCLGYGGIPKGLIEFHKYPAGSRTAFEEHLHEACTLSSNEIDIHLTVSPEFIDDFKTKLEEINKKTGFKINVTFSVQEKSTDTVALYDDGSIARDEDEKLLLRPGGHGALIKNLNKIDADIVFVKNIDNLTHGDYLAETVKHKKLLGGILIETAETIKQINSELKNSPNKNQIDNAIVFLKEEFNADFSNSKSIVHDILEYINKPIRVCGMVKNTGEPGGGPYWVKNSNKISLQIVEKAQIDLSKVEQSAHLSNATHFNPVDLACYLYSPDGEKFDLNSFVDKNACFISEKTHLSKNIRVLEHPGLWNGAMSDWLTIFVEVPLITFNPVKELNDLLRAMHQPMNS